MGGFNKVKVSTGDKYGRLSIVSERDKRNGHRFFLCECECGKESVVDLAKLRNGHTKSCGCLFLETVRTKSITHNKYQHPLYKVWSSMKSRCLNMKSTAYKDYGGRGITVCEAWMDFQAFYDWANKNGYSDGLTIERKNNSKGYSPGNCTFTSMARQSNNRRSNHFVEHDGKRMTMADWSRKVGINQTVIRKRINRGWSVGKALSEPLLSGINRNA